jgi:AGCS family alanine or glycine:cation symporter
VAGSSIGKTAFKVLNDYEEQRKQGLNPTFSPKKLGIENTEAWDDEGKSDKMVG